MTIYRMWGSVEPKSNERLFDEYIIYRHPVTFEEVGEDLARKVELLADKYQNIYVPAKETFESEDAYNKAIYDFREKCYGGWTEVPVEDFQREFSGLIETVE